LISVPSIEPPGVVVVVEGRLPVFPPREGVVVGLDAVVVRLTELASGDDEPHADTPIRATIAKTTDATHRFPMSE